MGDQIVGGVRVDAGTRFPDLRLPATNGDEIDPVRDSGGDFILFVYPRTGRPDQTEADDWALIPGAKGCTAESCEFRDLASEFSMIGLKIYGLSTQSTAYQQEAAERLHLPYLLLSDPTLKLGGLLGIPTFRYDGSELYRRSTLVVRAGVVVMTQLEIADAASHPRDLLATLTAAEG